MQKEPQSLPQSKIRTFFRYSWIAVVIGSLYVGFIFYSRWQENRDVEYRASQKAAAEKREQAARAVELMGGSSFEIMNFYAAPGAIRRGDSAELCYGVSNAKTVKIDPPLDGVWPSLNRCIEIAPSRTTTYKLTAEDAAGNKKSATLTLTVVPH
jgi:hypothetical protein